MTAKRKAKASQPSRLDKKREFLRGLADFLAANQAMKSIQLEMGNPAAKEWANLRRLTPLHGYPTVDEAEQILTEFLG